MGIRAALCLFNFNLTYVFSHFDSTNTHRKHKIRTNLPLGKFGSDNVRLVHPRIQYPNLEQEWAFRFSFYWKRWSLRPQRPPSPSLRRFISGSFLTSAEPAPLLRLRPLRPPLPFLRRWCASILPSGDRQSGSRCAPFLRRLSLPCGQPASASHRLPVRAAAHAPYLRRFSFPSVSAELISGRFPSSPLRASNPSGRQGGAVRSPGPARLRSSALHCADSASAGSGRTRFVPAPSLRRP